MAAPGGSDGAAMGAATASPLVAGSTRSNPSLASMPGRQWRRYRRRSLPGGIAEVLPSCATLASWPFSSRLPRWSRESVYSSSSLVEVLVAFKGEREHRKAKFGTGSTSDICSSSSGLDS